ncbi:VOC family protein [Actinoplanes bogorensis]|uniref:VOC family protein n=1 Tax=Paractinoplanes bogorensis TaxID=1610840 RepID=A0ABS5Z5I6_9ACTN|nr:VOC family protein [Actinoplanes bogorensis]
MPSEPDAPASGTSASSGPGGIGSPSPEAAPFFESALLDEETTTRLPPPGFVQSSAAQGSNQPDPSSAPASEQPDDPQAATSSEPAADGRNAHTSVAGPGSPTHPKTSPAAAALAAAAAAAAAQDRGPWADLAGNSDPDDSAADVITAYPSARPGPAGAIHGVGITVLVTDLNRSAAFYRDTLGFYEIDRGDGSAVLASGDTRLVLRTVHDLSAEAGRLIYLNLEVGDVEAVYQELVTKGVEFVHPPRPVNRGDRLELWSATFRDPDDHNIAITQWRAIR